MPVYYNRGHDTPRMYRIPNQEALSAGPVLIQPQTTSWTWKVLLLAGVLSFTVTGWSQQLQTPLDGPARLQC